ncbi:hypothetical protein L9F63_014537, partial [Diploptera punctata]
IKFGVSVEQSFKVCNINLTKQININIECRNLGLKKIYKFELNSLVDSIKFLFSAYTENMIEVLKVRHLGLSSKFCVSPSVDPSVLYPLLSQEKTLQTTVKIRKKWTDEPLDQKINMRREHFRNNCSIGQYSLARAQQSFKSLVQIHEKNGWFTPPKEDG